MQTARLHKQALYVHTYKNYFYGMIFKARLVGCMEVLQTMVTGTRDGAERDLNGKCLPFLNYFRIKHLIPYRQIAVGNNASSYRALLLDGHGKKPVQ